jgi:predicted acyltransferase
MMVNGALQLNGYNYTRFASVLGRIALSCFFAALIYLNCSVKKQLLWLLVLLTGYWAAMMWIPVPGHGAGVLTPEGNLSGHIDRLLLPGKLHRGSYDPEGLLSTIPAIATALLGIFVGQFMLDHWRMKPANAKSLPQSPGEVRSPVTNRYPSKKAGLVFVSGIILLIAGWGWGMLFPVNKNIWTSSFVLYSAGWSMMLFAVFYYIIDVKGYKTWSNPFIWMGMNAILIYIAAHGLVDFGSASEFLFGGLINKTPETWHPALLWSGVALVQFALLYFLYKKKWFLKM